MMGKTHIAVAFTGYCAYRLPQTWDELPSWGMGIVLAIFSSLLPDIDEPRSRIGGMLFPIFPPWLRPIMFLIIGAYFLYWGWNQLSWYFMVIGFLLVFFVLVKHRESPTHGLIGAVITGAVAYTLNPEFLIPVIIGYVGAHLLLDLLTEGIHLFWPIPIRIRIPFCRTNSILEKLLFYRGAQVVSLYLVAREYGEGIWGLFLDLRF